MDLGYRPSTTLASLQNLEMKRLNGEEVGYPSKRLELSIPVAALVSPPSPDRGPPPPYSYRSSTSLAVPDATAVELMSEHRHDQASEMMLVPQNHQSRQSLPSIHEALGTNEPLPPPRQSSISAVMNQSTFQVAHTVNQNSSSSPSIYERQPAERITATPRVMHTSEPTLAKSPAFAYPGVLPRSPAVGSRLPTLQPIITSASPMPPPRQPWSHTWQPQPSHPYNQSKIGPPQYAYPQYQPGSAFMRPMSAAPVTFHSTSSSYPIPAQPVPLWSEEDRKSVASHNTKKTAEPYGVSVKRHLDVFDMESAMNQIGEDSRQLLAFSDHYRPRAHQTQGSGPLPGSTPHLNEIEEKVQQTNQILDALARIREVVLAQQAALANKCREQQVKASNEHSSEDGALQEDEDNAGFAGSDSKKRRARAAPPGRCHSCNRAETPEWRRGPDGARTLCNACGLHYAKLTRKMGANKAPMGSSNLQPKSSSPGLSAM